MKGEESSPWKANLLLILKAYLVKCCLRDRVVFYVESLFALGKDAENPGQGRQWRWKLVLKHVSVLLLQDASWKGEFKELLYRLQVRVRPCYSNNYCITISKPESRKKKILKTGKKIILKAGKRKSNWRLWGNLSKEYLTLRSWKRKWSLSDPEISLREKEPVVIYWIPILFELPCWVL